MDKLPKELRTEEDYEAAVAEAKRLYDSPPGTPEAERLDRLVDLIEAYETKYYSD
ncbi:MAG TPA: hypothetical protein VK842_03420 [bacterium]|jgi:antitoxin component HigA of HigAB toxin-antitoxin module|nr:hypothetical protein [bacterium]